MSNEPWPVDCKKCTTLELTRSLTDEMAYTQHYLFHITVPAAASPLQESNNTIDEQIIDALICYYLDNLKLDLTIGEAEVKARQVINTLISDFIERIVDECLTLEIPGKEYGLYGGELKGKILEQERVRTYLNKLKKELGKL